MSFFITLETLPSFFLFLLVPTFLGYVAILVAVEVLWLPIFEVIAGLPYILVQLR